MKVFVSSTYRDLVEHRHAAVEAIQRLDEQVGAMEVFGARPAEATTASLDEIDRCELFVGIYAHRYGSLAPDSDLSITEAEYLHARARKKPCFCFLVDEDYPWPPKQIEYPQADTLQSFKKDLQQAVVVETFRDPTDLALKVATSIARYLKEVADTQDRPVTPTPAATTNADPGRYLDTLLAEHRYLEIRDMGAKTTEQVELAHVYTRLRVATPSGGTDATPKTKRRSGRRRSRREAGTLSAAAQDDAMARDRELRDLLPEYPTLVLVGDPGSGKTTFLRFVALNLARAARGHESARAMAAVGLVGDPPFPIFVRLAAFGDFLTDHPDKSVPDESVQHFYRYLDYRMRGLSLGLPESYLRDRVAAGGCALLLDGLDEVPGAATRERVGRIVEQVVGVAPNRVVVTARTRAYADRVQLAGFIRASLVDFGPAEIDSFTRQWARALFRLAPDDDQSPTAVQADAYRSALLEAIRAHPSVQPMTANPLMPSVLGKGCGTDLDRAGPRSQSTASGRSLRHCRTRGRGLFRPRRTLNLSEADRPALLDAAMSALTPQR